MKTALITGCNGGLGQRLMTCFAGHGYNIIACSIFEDDMFLKQCRELENAKGITISHVVYDSTDNVSLDNALQFIEDFDGEINVLVNGAGINIMKPLLYTDLEDLQKTFTINYFSAVLFAKKVAEKMVRQGNGVIVNVSSIGSMGHQPGGACYDASKAALNQFTISIAQELAPFGIRVNAVAPAPMNTPMFFQMPEKAQKNLVKSVAFKRPAETEEVANLIYFLASKDASYITGQIIRVDGGAII